MSSLVISGQHGPHVKARQRHGKSRTKATCQYHEHRLKTLSDTLANTVMYRVFYTTTKWEIVQICKAVPALNSPSL